MNVARLIPRPSDRPFHVMALEVLEAFLAAKRIRLVGERALDGTAAAATFDYGGERYTITIARAGAA